MSFQWELTDQWVTGGATFYEIHRLSVQGWDASVAGHPVVQCVGATCDHELAEYRARTLEWLGMASPREGGVLFWSSLDLLQEECDCWVDLGDFRDHCDPCGLGLSLESTQRGVLAGTFALRAGDAVDVEGTVRLDRMGR